MKIPPKYRDLFNLTYYDFQYTIGKGDCPRCQRKNLLVFPLGTHYWLYCVKCGLCSWAHSLEQPNKKGNKYQYELHERHRRMVILCQTHYHQIESKIRTKLHLSSDPRNMEKSLLAPILGLGIYRNIAQELYAERIYLSTDLPFEERNKPALFLPIEAVPGFLIGWLVITENGEWKAKANVYSKLIEWVYLKIGGGEPTIELDNVNEGIVCYLNHLGYDEINIIAKPVLQRLTLMEPHPLT